MGAPSADLIIKALDGLSARAVVTAQNIANAGTPGYRPSRVTFEQALAAAAGKGSDAVRAVTPQVVRGGDSQTSPDLRLDLEVATASTTAARYAALIEVLGRQMQIQALAGSRNS